MRLMSGRASYLVLSMSNATFVGNYYDLSVREEV